MPNELRKWLFASAIAQALIAPSAIADFKYEIAPIFARHGCAAADCHGGATGRGGFKLSLFATEPRTDYEAIARELGGRRLDFRQAGESLLLKKPTKRVKHGGGKIFDTSSEVYQQLFRWIESGARFANDASEDRTLDGLQVSNDRDQLTVVANFSNHTDRDVTHLALFESTEPNVVEVDEDGMITRIGPGKAWLLARFSGMSARTRVNIPFPGGAVTIPASDHPLDQAWAAALREQNLQPIPTAKPHVLARRLYFDLANRPPNPEELRAFQGRSPAERVTATCDQLLGRESFVESFHPHLESWFVQPSRDRQSARVVEALRGNEPLSNLVDDLFRPGLDLRGDPRDKAEFVGSQLLGISIGCARCHNHPHDRWTQAEHLRFSALFRTRPEGHQLALDPFFVPGEGHRPVRPALLPIVKLESKAELPPDIVLTSFVVDGGHDLFSRNFANRVFQVLLGRPLVDSPDDHRLSNPPVHEALLMVLASHFKQSGYDLRELVRFIVTSQLYALASHPPDVKSLTGDPELKYFARREARALTRTQFERAITSVLGLEDSTGGDRGANRPMMSSDNVADSASPLADQLAILNSGLIQRGLASKGNEVEAIFTFSASGDQALRDLYTLVLSRPPRSDEVQRLLPIATKALSNSQQRDDLATALFLSREFGSIR